MGDTSRKEEGGSVMFVSTEDDAWIFDVWIAGGHKDVAVTPNVA